MSTPPQKKEGVKSHSIGRSKGFNVWLKDIYNTFSDSNNKRDSFWNLFTDSIENILHLDIDIENKKVTYIRYTDKRKYSTISECYNDSKNLRVSTKIGRLIKRLSNSKISLSDREIELINNHFLTHCAENNFSNNPLVVWTPDKVPYAYLENNYSKMAGTLGSSCMRYSSCAEKMDFYAKNNISIVVLLPKKTKKDSPKIRARALLWYNIKVKDKKGTYTLLDKVYTSDDSLLPLFEAYAKGHGFYQKVTSSGCSYKLKGRPLTNKPLFIKELNYLQWKLPYLDTMRYLYPGKMVLTNDSKYLFSKTMITLTSTGGEFPELDPNLVRELFTSTWISKDTGKFIRRKGYSGWVALDNIVVLSTSSSSGGRSPTAKEYSKFDPKLVESHSLNGLVYVFKEESTFSKLMNINILKRESVPVYKLTEENNKEFSIIKSDVILPQAAKGITLLWTGDYITTESNIEVVICNGRTYPTKILKNTSETHTRQYYFGESYKNPATYKDWYKSMPLEEIPHPNHITDLSMLKFEDYVVQYKTKKGDSIDMKVKAEINKTREKNKDYIDKHWFFPVNACKTIDDWNKRWNDEQNTA